ncbi:hypothetical protein EV183_000759 [Coemansia sp. RSA 2336]|nr:hypothetical protein EV183_000759 [Coemansia sp. RSA 2336]
MPFHRKKPFSAKKKKAQLQSKRASKREQHSENDNHQISLENQSIVASAKPAFKIQQPVAGNGRNKLTSQFDKLSRVEIEANKERSMKPLKRLDPEDGLIMSFDQAYSADVDIPVRPNWEYGESKEQVEERELNYFNEWLERLQESKDESAVSLYEKNLEVWRQLWRVVEISDILLLIVDIRHPVLHFPPSLYRYITETTGKPLVVVLNKTDLVAETTVQAWMHYFKQKFPSVVLTRFRCFKDQALVDDTKLADMKMRKSRPRKRTHDARLVGDLFAACRSVCEKSKLDLVDWNELIARYTDDTEEEEDEDEEEEEEEDESSDEEESNVEEMENTGHGERVNSKYVTLGLVGHPNVGKSTIINSIMQRTVVSTSRTPGHTKHFQTIHVTSTLRLCDCPGLVFPCVVERPMQVLAGLYNIAQVQEPYTSVMYLAERVPVERVLTLQPPVDNPDLLQGVNYKWSAWSICEAFAHERGFYTSKGARPDVYRAALHILRWVLDGRILLSFKPPNFFSSLEYLRAAAKEEEQQGGGHKSKDSSTHEASSDDEDLRQPVARQSMFALLEEESC